MQNAQEFMGNVPTLLKPGKEELRNLTEVIVHQPAPQERVGKWWKSLRTQVQTDIGPWFSPCMRKFPRAHQNALQSPDTHRTNDGVHLSLCAHANNMLRNVMTGKQVVIYKSFCL